MLSGAAAAVDHEAVGVVAAGGAAGAVCERSWGVGAGLIGGAPFDAVQTHPLHSPANRRERERERALLRIDNLSGAGRSQVIVFMGKASTWQKSRSWWFRGETTKHNLWRTALSAAHTADVVVSIEIRRGLAACSALATDRTLALGPSIFLSRWSVAISHRQIDEQRHEG